MLKIPLGGIDLLPTLSLLWTLPHFECALITHFIVTRVSKMGGEVSGAAISHPVRRFQCAGECSEKEWLEENTFFLGEQGSEEYPTTKGLV